MREQELERVFYEEYSLRQLEDERRFQIRNTILFLLLGSSLLVVCWWIYFELHRHGLLGEGIKDSRPMITGVLIIAIIMNLSLILFLDSTLRKSAKRNLGKLFSPALENFRNLYPQFGKQPVGSFLFTLIGLLKLTLPHKVRREIYDPYTEEIKEDFLTAPTEGWKWQFVKTAFYFRLIVIQLQCLYHWLVSLAFPILGKKLGLSIRVGKGGKD